MRSARSAWASVVLLNGGMVIGIVLVMHAVSRSALIPCVAPPFGSTVVACGIAVILDLAILPKMRLGHLGSAVMLVSIMGMLSAWLGLYPVSPLGFGLNGRSVIEGFRIIRYGRPVSLGGLGDAATVTAGSAVEIEPISLAGVQVECHWYSATGGAFDDPDSCDVAYLAPSDRTFDHLRVLARPSCGLPNYDAELRTSIEP